MVPMLGGKVKAGEQAPLGAWSGRRPPCRTWHRICWRRRLLPLSRGAGRRCEKQAVDAGDRAAKNEKHP